jgi:hypothetical protein
LQHLAYLGGGVGAKKHSDEAEDKKLIKSELSHAKIKVKTVCRCNG